MRIDLHVHTSPRSPCSIMPPDEAVSEAARLGLDALCLTEHHVLWPADELQRLEDVAGIRVFGGTEIATDHGDVLVFGLEAAVEEFLTIAEVRRRVDADGGVMIAAHPFRGQFLFGRGTVDPVQSAGWPLFEYVHAVEVCNGRLDDAENCAAGMVAAYLGLPGVAGSDAHRLSEIGHCVTVLNNPVADERELIEALRSGSCSVETANGRVAAES